MDILIKNMEMPVDCRFCRFYRKQKDGIHYCHAQRMAISGGTEVIDKIRKGCPLVALPEHGDLIDRKALSDAIGKVITDRDRMIGTYDTIEQIIEGAETIVEATE